MEKTLGKRFENRVVEPFRRRDLRVTAARRALGERRATRQCPARGAGHPTLGPVDTTGATTLRGAFPGSLGPLSASLSGSQWLYSYNMLEFMSSFDREEAR